MYREYELEIRRQLISQLLDYIRLAQDMHGAFIKLIDYAIDNDNEKLLITYKEIRKLDKNVSEFQKNLTNELFRAGPYLTNSEVLYSLITLIGDIVNLIDGAGYRLSHLGLEALKAEYLENLKDIALKLYDEIDAFREAAYLLGYNPPAVRSAIEKVYLLESEIDEIHRSSLAYIYTTETDPKNILKWLEVAERLEQAADHLEKAADLLIALLL